MELPDEYRSEEELIALRDDFDFAHTLLKHAVRKDLPSFSLSSLRVPAILQGRALGTPVATNEALALEVAIFQDHLNGRIVLLAQNTRMLREIWAANERTRPFRQIELKTYETAIQAVDSLADLVGALIRRAEDDVVSTLNRCLTQRLALVDGLIPLAAAASANALGKQGPTSLQ